MDSEDKEFLKLTLEQQKWCLALNALKLQIYSATKFLQHLNEYIPDEFKSELRGILKHQNRMEKLLEQIMNNLKYKIHNDPESIISTSSQSSISSFLTIDECNDDNDDVQTINSDEIVNVRNFPLEETEKKLSCSGNDLYRSCENNTKCHSIINGDLEIEQNLQGNHNACLVNDISSCYSDIRNENLTENSLRLLDKGFKANDDDDECSIVEIIGNKFLNVPNKKEPVCDDEISNIKCLSIFNSQYETCKENKPETSITSSGNNNPFLCDGLALVSLETIERLRTNISDYEPEIVSIESDSSSISTQNEVEIEAETAVEVEKDLQDPNSFEFSYEININPTIEQNPDENFQQIFNELEPFLSLRSKKTDDISSNNVIVTVNKSFIDNYPPVLSMPNLDDEPIPNLITNQNIEPTSNSSETNNSSNVPDITPIKSHKTITSIQQQCLTSITIPPNIDQKRQPLLLSEVKKRLSFQLKPKPIKKKPLVISTNNVIMGLKSNNKRSENLKPENNKIIKLKVDDSLKVSKSLIHPRRESKETPKDLNAVIVSNNNENCEETIENSISVLKNDNIDFSINNKLSKKQDNINQEKNHKKIEKLSNSDKNKTDSCQINTLKVKDTFDESPRKRFKLNHNNGFNKSNNTNGSTIKVPVSKNEEKKNSNKSKSSSSKFYSFAKKDTPCNDSSKYSKNNSKSKTKSSDRYYSTTNKNTQSITSKKVSKINSNHQSHSKTNHK